ncbi:related to 3-(3-Hydroxyphenyl)propionate 2-hydroxylase [Phialocephala subalpina]|uniref:Related to 3-(3-Hydroxyphenyl)propionate 2-hydroxylase n=1 Tax=Phialocephala subalpina TaxID=576137 RepID=A0A1L7WC69_9HELO|nr:related to 3-(3-Hydroxyphenyl)propionate 2-hydroxylase [Phialocephala subalpina]
MDRHMIDDNSTSVLSPRRLCCQNFANQAQEQSSSAVTIIGAGPVGLYAALLLGRAGIDVQVFDAEQFVSQSPRAIAYFPVVLGDFKKSGIYDDVVAAGFKNTIGVSWRKPKTGGQLAHLGGNDPTKFAIHLGQHDLANIILAHLKKYPSVRLQFDARLEGLDNLVSEDRVIAHLVRGPEKVVVRHVSRFLIGADGGRSTARKLLGIPLEGFTWSDFQIIAANIIYDLDTFSDWGPANFIVDPELWSVVAKTGTKTEKGYEWRVATGERDVGGEEWDEEKALIRLRKRLELLLPGPTEEAEVVKISPYKMHQRCASTFRNGNVVLAGDAAHLTNPVGGLGLTTGLMDSSLLAPALKKILLEGEPSTLLDSYAETRRGVFLNYTNPTATANRQRLLSTDADTVKEREDLFAKINKPDIPFLKDMFEAELSICSTRD